MASSTTTDVLLIVNSGSSTVKSALFTRAAEPALVARGRIDGNGSACVSRLVAWADEHVRRSDITAIGHRIVHGGPRYRAPLRITPQVVADLVQLVPFAPNHLPREIAMINALDRHAPGIPQVACFDTAFHQHMPDVARRLAIPAVYDRRGVQRYGFHGLSYAFLMEELARIAGTAAKGRVVLAHLGNGSSLAAVRDGTGIDTTMGFTPIGGVVMSTRSGDLDPGVVTYLGRAAHLSPEAIEDLLSKRSGLLALSETTGDMEQLIERAPSDAAAQAAVDAYVYSVGKAMGALAAALGGIDTLVFSGGIGEHAATIRERTCDMLPFLGIAIDAPANARHAAIISTSASRVVVRVIPTNEELMIARATSRLLASV